MSVLYRKYVTFIKGRYSLIVNMSLKNYLHRGLRFIVKGTPVKNITADISYLQPNKRLFGKKIIITGGGRGLGASMAA